MTTTSAWQTPIGRVSQIGIIVDDIVEAVDRYGALFGVTDWLRYTYDPSNMPRLWYRGAQGTFGMHIALGDANPQVELIEPVSGPSVYHEHLAQHGPGVHHLAAFVDSLDHAIETMSDRGYPLLQYGRDYGLDGDGGFAYFDTLCDFHTTIEAIQVPRRRRPPLTTWNRD